MTSPSPALSNFSIPRLLWPLLALALILSFNFYFTPGFFAVRIEGGRFFGSIIDIMNRGAPILLVAIGMTFVIATGGVDLSVGAIMAIAGSVAAFVVVQTGSTPLAILAALVSGLACGLWNAALVTLLDIQPFVATLVLMVAGRGVAQLVTSGQIINFEGTPLRLVARGALFAIPLPILLALVVFMIATLLTRLTAAGLFIESVGNNPTAARFAGISERLVKTIAYGASGVCSAIAGLIVAADIQAADANHAGLYAELDAILAVVIGGTALAGGRFTLLGSVIGALILQSVITTILTRGVPAELTRVVEGVVVITVCLLYAPKFRAMLLRPFKSRH